MNIKRIIEKDTRTAFEKIKALYGEDTAILSNKKVGSQVEVVVAIDLNDGSYQLQTDPEAEVGEVVSKPRKKIHTNYADAPKVDWMQARRTAEQQVKPTETLTEKESIEQVRKLLEKTRPEPDTSSVSGVEEDKATQPSISSLALEMSMLRDMFQTHLEQTAMLQKESLTLDAKDILRTLEQQCVLPEQLVKLQSELVAKSNEPVLSQTLSWFNERLCSAEFDPVKEGGIYALVGLSGVGKTTTIAKLASQGALIHGRERIALVTLDHNRIGSREQMNLFAMMLGVDVINASSTRELKSKLAGLSEKRLVLIDTAGVSLRSNGLPVLVDALTESHRQLKVILTLAANNQTAINRQNVDALKGKVCGCVATKLDETLSLGGIVSSLVDSQIPVIGVSEGPEIPSCYRPITGLELVNLWFDIPQTSSVSKPALTRTSTDLGFSALSELKLGSAL